MHRHVWVGKYTETEAPGQHQLTSTGSGSVPFHSSLLDQQVQHDKRQAVPAVCFMSVYLQSAVVHTHTHHCAHTHRHTSHVHTHTHTRITCAHTHTQTHITCAHTHTHTHMQLVTLSACMSNTAATESSASDHITDATEHTTSKLCLCVY